jgi:hypothetical protein
MPNYIDRSDLGECGEREKIIRDFGELSERGPIQLTINR